MTSEQAISTRAFPLFRQSQVIQVKSTHTVVSLKPSCLVHLPTIVKGRIRTPWGLVRNP